MPELLKICAIGESVEAAAFIICRRFICGMTQLKARWVIERSYGGAVRASPKSGTSERDGIAVYRQKEDSVSLLGFAAIWIASLMIIGVAIWSAVRNYEKEDMRDSEALRDEERLGAEKKLRPLTGPNQISVD
jgi:hypothetical protein